MQATALNDREARQTALLEEELEHYEEHFDEFRGSSGLMVEMP